MTREAKLDADLPERFALLYDCDSGRFETPLDGTGIADIDEIFELAIRTYPDQLPQLDNAERNRHHVYWTESWWKKYANLHDAKDRQTILTFRNSTPQIAYVPLELHAWIEDVMIPPPPPDMQVMRRRNSAWTAACMLLGSAHKLDQAREEYAEKRHTTRRVLGYMAGKNAISRDAEHMNIEEIEVLNDEYWLSELNHRLHGWKSIADIQDALPSEHRLVPSTRLSDVRTFRQRIRKRAIVPTLPALIRATAA